MSSFPVGHNLVSEIKSFWKESLQINLWLEFFWDLCWPEQLGALPKEQQQGTVLLWFSLPTANCQLNCQAFSPLGYSSPAVAYTRTMNPIRPLFVQGFTLILFISLPIKSLWRADTNCTQISDWYDMKTNLTLLRFLVSLELSLLSMILQSAMPKCLWCKFKWSETAVQIARRLRLLPVVSNRQRPSTCSAVCCDA